MSFDALRPFSDAEYEAFIAELCDSTVDALRAAANATELSRAILAYIERAYAAHLSPGEMTDFFCVSDGCVIDRLSLSETEADGVVSLFDHLHDEFIATRRPF